MTFNVRINNLKPQSRKSQFIALLRLCMFAGFFLWIFSGLYKTLDIYRYFNAHNWPKAEATIVKSTSSDSDTYYRMSCSRPSVAFSYFHDGMELKSDKWGFSFFDCSSREWADGIAKRYSVGSKVTAFVNPKSGLAVLDPSLFCLWLMTLMGVGCGAIIWIIRPKKNH